MDQILLMLYKATLSSMIAVLVIAIVIGFVMFLNVSQ